MKYLLLVLFSTFCLSSIAQVKTICVSADCKDTIRLPQDTVTLNSQGSSSSTITSYVWKAIGNNTSITNVSAQNTVARGLSVPGMYVYSVTASSAAGFASAYDTVVVLAAINKLPVANIVASALILNTSQTLTLDGSSSTDSDGTITKYQWSGPNLGNSNLPIVTASNWPVGTYVYTLVVTDNNGGLGSKSVTITVIAAPVKIVIVTIANFNGTGKTLTVYNDGTSILQ